MLYRRGQIWWYKFRFARPSLSRIRENKTQRTCTTSRTETATTLEESYNGRLTRPSASPKLFSASPLTEWLELKQAISHPKATPWSNTASSILGRSSAIAC